MSIDQAAVIRLRSLNKSYEAHIRILSEELHKTRAAIATLDSEREANEILTNQVEYLLMVIAMLMQAK